MDILWLTRRPTRGLWSTGGSQDTPVTKAIRDVLLRHQHHLGVQQDSLQVRDDGRKAQSRVINTQEQDGVPEQ